MPKLINKTANKTTVTKTPIKAKPATKAAAKPITNDAPEISLAERIHTERTHAASLFAQLDTASVSVPVKPLSAYKRAYKANVTAHAIGRKPTVRQAAAIAVACLSNGGKIADKQSFKRQFDRNGATYAIENGALSDALSSGLCTYDTTTETITITNAGEIAGQLGSTLKSFAA